MLLTLVCFTCFAACCWAQQPPSAQQAPAGAPAPPSAPGTGPSTAVNNPGSTEAPTEQMQPDTHPLGGAYLFTLGSPFEGGRSYFQPSFSIGEAGETNASGVPNGKQNVTMITIPMASFALVHQTRTNELSLGYLGGGFIYDNGASGVPDSSFHAFNLSDGIRLRRWTLNLSDVFSYLPSASFGFGGLGIFGGLSSGFFSGMSSSGGMGAVNPMYSNNQSILGNGLSAYNNTALAQATYSATKRTSVSFAGSYGILTSGGGQSGFFDGHNLFGLFGVGHALTARDTIGVTYSYGSFNYSGLQESFHTQRIDLAYGRKITGRVALQLYGGPEILTFHTLAGPSTTQVSVNGSGSLSYERGHNFFSVFGGRYATSGSGVYAGAQTELVDGSWNRQLTRWWAASLSMGYSRNSSFKAFANTAETHYGYGFADLVLNRAIGRYLRLTVGYEYQRQQTNRGACTTSFCAGNLTNQIFGLGLTITPRPIGL
ncbi:MAG TPA: hypothetical protein VFZ08_03140 [Terriglobia bacterium]|nr:hypothetical protein [Terriglobia bacterium]